ncbi:winged helix-turn-helix domain-containing tetratricopeptide repeat protein [Litorisediminicola beolgyonensis]|uniref:Winged helix-turn-helix domain-containing tetratricopeptide repeat protein n=1 Tax=Litorisediminicola beolgyonensis TaxID=1173614 RepID=A0ABW3ZEW3_9RHOB
MIGAFRFNSETEELTSPDGTKIPLRPQTARVLGVLARHRRALVTKDALMSEVWPDTHVTDDSLVQCISEIRRALGADDAKRLATVPKQGYRLAATTAPEAAAPTEAPSGPDQQTKRRSRSRIIAALVASMLLVLAIAAARAFLNSDTAPQPALTIAVLPFENLSSDPEQDYLSSGLAEDLLTDLSRLKAMKVLSRNTTFGLRSAPETVSDTMARYGATHMVDGSVQREGAQIRISVQLVQLATGSNVWAQRYDRQLGDLFDIQDDVRAKIVDALSLRLAPQEQARLLDAGTSDVSAYDLLLQGRHFEAALDRPGVTRALSLYRQALDVDPGYTEAYARLANMYDFSSRYGWGESAETDRVLAIEMAERAVRLDPENPFARWTLGRILSRLGRTPSSRERGMGELRAAIEIDPNYADAYGFIALVYVGGGETDAARQAIATAFDLNQTPPYWYYQNRGIVSYFDEEYLSAVEDFLRAVEMSPTAAFSRLWLAAAYAMTGDVDAADWEIEEAQMLGEPQTVTDVLTANPIIQDPDFQSAYATGLARAGLPD